MAELVDAADLKSVEGNLVPVRFRPSAPFLLGHPKGCFFYTKLMRIKEDSKRVKICIKNNMITSERGSVAEVDFICNFLINMIL